MYVIASFEQSIFLELAITALEQSGVPKNQILAVPLDKRSEDRKLFDTIHRADGFSLFDVAAVLGTCGMLLGAIYGMVLRWGPILWGLIGLCAGLLLGFLLKVLFVKKQNKKTKQNRTSEVFLVIRCTNDQGKNVENILWDNTALGIARLNNE
ncbi:hypothetical protein NZD89_16240 [Alicyclobacillus fastidiosus]|uniref:Uncharacterized protein n=1 Tax=Alicyclobacillus fastidiosus TaxID=392011 RepID=A0ABY6ZAQ8_9BACL|nr:hypothetical protein [Alicyclobacillus fastidiosus]WAH39946.1 hypothetical protein NZD89_16240 [Alicyclobacillus fastidiosus]GMA61227.1 hypothetical protein GCM10025859_16670 [Alicyclobacillus fastidiosus]